MWLPKRGKEMLVFFPDIFPIQWSFPLPSGKGKAKFYRILMDSAISCPNSYIFVRPHVMVYKAFQIGERARVLLEK